MICLVICLFEVQQNNNTVHVATTILFLLFLLLERTGQLSSLATRSGEGKEMKWLVQ